MNEHEAGLDGKVCTMCKERPAVIANYETFYWCAECWCEAIDLLESAIIKYGWKETRRRIEHG